MTHREAEAVIILEGSKKLPEFFMICYLVIFFRDFDF